MYKQELCSLPSPYHVGGETLHSETVVGTHPKSRPETRDNAAVIEQSFRIAVPFDQELESDNFYRVRAGRPGKLAVANTAPAINHVIGTIDELGTLSSRLMASKEPKPLLSLLD